MDVTVEDLPMPDPEEITIIVHNATGLKGKLGGGRKFFVVFGLGETKYRTTVVINQEGNPVWNEENTVTVSNTKDEVFLIVREKDNVLGQILVPVATIQGPKDRMHKQALQPHKKCRKPHGELTYQCFVSKHQDTKDPLLENETIETENAKKKKKFRLSFEGEKLEKIDEGDTYSDDLADVEQIDLEDLIKNAQPEKKADAIENSPDSDPHDQTNENKNNDNIENGLNVPSDNELDYEVANAKETLSKADDTHKSSFKIKPKLSKKKQKERAKLDSQSDSITSDQTENVTSDQSEKEPDAQDIAYKKGKKKRFSLKFLRRKKLLDQTKKALGKDSTADQNTENQNHDKAGPDETFENDTKYLEEVDKHSEKSDIASVSSENSQPVENENNKEPEDVKIVYTEEHSDAEEKNKDITDDDNGDLNLENRDDNINDGIQDNVGNYEQTDDQVVLSGINIDSGDKKEIVTELADINSSPLSKTEADGNKSKTKKRFSVKFLSGGSDKTDKSVEEGNAKAPYTGVSPSQSTPDKDKSKWKLPFLGSDKEEKQPEITKCTPNKGPVDEPTRVCLEGFNLGTGKSDITSLKVAGCDCLDTVEFESPQMIYCKTHFQFESHTGPVEIITKSGGQGILLDGFTFFDEMDAYTPKSPKSVTFQGEVDMKFSQHANEGDSTKPDVSRIKSSSKTTDDVSSFVTLRPKLRRLLRSSSETELNSRYKPNSFAEEQTESMFRIRQRQGRRLSDYGLKPRRKAPAVPDKDDVRLRRRASESAIKLMARGLISSRESDSSLVRRKSDTDQPLRPAGKRKAPAPPMNQRPKSLPVVVEHEDSDQKEELLETIKKLEEDNAALQKDVTRLRNYIDSLVSKVMDRCPTALLQDNHLKTNFFL